MSNWPTIEYDSDGYPTEESLEAVKVFPMDFIGAHKFVRDTLEDCAENCCASYSEEEVENTMSRKVIHGNFSTGGWSGAEDIISLIQSRMDTGWLMLQWRRGGHYVFEFVT